MDAHEITIGQIRDAIDAIRAGDPAIRIAERLGLSHAAVIRIGIGPDLVHPQARARLCMTCRRPFASAHFGNRICSSCLRSGTFAAGLGLGGLPSRRTRKSGAA